MGLGWVKNARFFFEIWSWDVKGRGVQQDGIGEDLIDFDGDMIRH